MSTSLDIIDNVADAITRLRFLEKKSKDDDEMLQLLKRQKDEIASELADAKHNFGVELYQMQQERDDALKRARETQMVIETLGEMALSGIRKMRGDEIQQPGTKPPQIVKHLQPADKRLPQITPEMDARLPPRDPIIRQG